MVGNWQVALCTSTAPGTVPSRNSPSPMVSLTSASSALWVISNFLPESTHAPPMSDSFFGHPCRFLDVECDGAIVGVGQIGARQPRGDRDK
eukprot:194841-Rhodomonas_salina.1